MKCYYCNSEDTFLMTNCEYICHHCADERHLVTCTKLGKVIADPEFYCDYVCNDCIYEEEDK